ncbi:ABC transporter ATP-binding protein [Promicromonospora iranensis]|uniref:Osmoprotectant transport system ATP-binding protein n=1 Tax=Promicromonospora iranensis TaxID=1105144 RepID=A0ABU2CKT4_9MICO|nr:ATP-binding cassette domain-containing protein [Promicromonospora iranensis]MDR7381931.1 osmoprotectant transport system ATP-binding protein [Promicromonospora iranensis]
MTARTVIELESVRKAFGTGAVAVEGLSLAVREHEILALVGPSGCGKSTTLRMVNRLVEPTSGRILLNGEDVTTADPVALRRRIGYVIQNVGLFPHRTVEANISTVPALLGWDRRRTRARVAELLELVGLPAANFAKRYPHELSGGERQRIGVARALATDPPVLLMDEPFGAVDPEFRRHLQTEFARIHRETGTTVILVTHDIDEAARLGDRIAVLSRGGTLEQIASPLAVLAHPASDRVRDFIGDGSASRMLALAQVQAADLESADHIVQPAPAPVRLGARLTDAFEAVAALPGSAMGRVPVVGKSGDVVGSLTADGILGALRRAADAAGAGPDAQDAVGGVPEDAPGREPAV